MTIEQKLQDMGLQLPEPMVMPPGIPLHFAWVRLHGDRVLVSGHAAQKPDGSFAGPAGKVGTDVSEDAARESARLVALSVLGSLKRALGNLDRIDAWLSVSGFVNVAPGFQRTTGIIDGFSDLILNLFGPERGTHARTAIGVAQTPLNAAVIVAAEVALRPS